ncbi:LytR/AlgR family response regulator transcription factor [Spirosoma gilvum]
MTVYFTQTASNPAELLTWPPLRVYTSDSGAKWRAVADLMYLRGEANYTWLHWVNESPILIPYTLKRMEAKLPSAWFTRTHRHYVVNQRFMEQIELSNSGTTLHLTNGAALPISRRRWSFLRRQWAGDNELIEQETTLIQSSIAPRLTVFPPDKSFLSSILIGD